jgi:hypothetical protein
MKLATVLSWTLMTVLSALSATAFAADIRNNDTKGYKFKLFDGNISSSRSIRPRGSLYGLCSPSNTCKVVLNGRTSMTFNANSKLKIEGGVLKPQ